MRKRQMALIAFMLLMVGAARANVDMSNAPFQTTARAVEQDHPPGCLHAYPVDVTLQGRLVGLVGSAGLLEDPPSPAAAVLYLQLDQPISVCASNTDEPAEKVPAYVNVSRIAMGSWSVALYHVVMQKWGQDQIRLTGTLNRPYTIHQIGPFFMGIKQFCSREITGKNIDDFHCMKADAWFQSLPSGGKYDLCVGGECVKALAHFARSSSSQPRLLTGAAPNSLKLDMAAQQVADNHPPDCLSYWPHIVTLRGRLGGVVYPGTPEWDPPVHGFVSVSLSVEQPVSLCAVPGLGIPAFTNVSQVGMGLWSVAAAQLLIKKWGRDEIQITGGLESFVTLPGANQGYTALFTDYKQFCSRDLTNKDKHTFKCVAWDTWIQNLGKEVKLAPDTL